MAELHQMFVDLATLVNQQGELLDQIDYAVKNAADYTEKADKDLVIAQKNMSKRKKVVHIVLVHWSFVVEQFNASVRTRVFFAVGLLDFLLFSFNRYFGDNAVDGVFHMTSRHVAYFPIEMMGEWQRKGGSSRGGQNGGIWLGN